MKRRLLVHLNLDEIVALNPPVGVEGEQKRIKPPYEGIQKEIRKGVLAQPSLARDPNRPQKVLAIVREKFQALAQDIEIRLGNGAGADRCIKARWAFGIHPRRCGVSAQATGRMKPKYVPSNFFEARFEDDEKDVTGYVFEGAILAEAELLLPEEKKEKFDFNSIVATVIAHELGHNLGLIHTCSPHDIMYGYKSEEFRDKPNDQQKLWISRAEQNKLTFKHIEVRQMQLALANALFRFGTSEKKGCWTQ